MEICFRICLSCIVLPMARTARAPAVALALLLTLCITPPTPAAEPLSWPAAVSAASGDTFWLISTRHLTSDACQANLEAPALHVQRIDACGRAIPATLDQYFNEADPAAMEVIYVHGNRMPACEAVNRGRLVYHRTVRYQTINRRPIRWLIWSWPSERQGLALRDVRIKAQRTDAQSLYLAWLLREQIRRGMTPKLIGFSFGGRVATGSLHALAGGSVGGRRLPGDHQLGAGIAVGLLAPAIGSDWLAAGRQHGLATQNISHLTLLYNESDAVLKRFGLLDPVGNVEAMGYEGPRSFAPRADGSQLPVAARDCSNTLGRRHSEADYYSGRCEAGRYMMAMLMLDQP